MRKLLTTLEPGDVLLIPRGAGASIEFIHKSGKRSRVSISCDEPVTLTRARSNEQVAGQNVPVARRPVPRTG